MRRFTLVLCLSMVILPGAILAQSAATDEKEAIERTYHLELDGVVVKITIRGNPKIMNQVLTREIRMRKEIVNIHQHVGEIHKSMENIGRELNLQCPRLKKMLEQRRQHHQQALKAERQKLQRAIKLRADLQQKPPEKPADSAQLYQELDKALDKVVEKDQPPAVESDEKTLEETADSPDEAATPTKEAPATSDDASSQETEPKPATPDDASSQETEPKPPADTEEHPNTLDEEHR